jgi:tRNA(Leu) C34 or U34 (ribose-2'-O)-methylase TrmL
MGPATRRDRNSCREKLYDERVTIPQRGMTESLNLTVSDGVVLFEFFRQAPTSEKPEHAMSVVVTFHDVG